jgi:hypothetical protein
MSPSSALNMQIVCSFETLISIYEFTQRYNLKEQNRCLFFFVILSLLQCTDFAKNFTSYLSGENKVVIV